MRKLFKTDRFTAITMITDKGACLAPGDTLIIGGAIHVPDGFSQNVKLGDLVGGVISSDPESNYGYSILISLRPSEHDQSEFYRPLLSAAFAQATKIITVQARPLAGTPTTRTRYTTLIFWEKELCLE